MFDKFPKIKSLLKLEVVFFTTVLTETIQVTDTNLSPLGRVTHVTLLAASPVHVATLGARPVIRAEQSFALLRRCLPDRLPQLLLLSKVLRLLFATAVAACSPGKVDIAALRVQTEPVSFAHLKALCSGSSSSGHFNNWLKVLRLRFSPT